MWSRRRKLRATLIIVVGAALTCLALVLTISDALRQLELDTVDTRFEIRGRQAPPDHVVGVYIDDKTFQDLRERWPFPRSMHGRVIDELRRAGAKAIAYDVQFTEPSGDTAADIREDLAVFDAVGRARGRVVLATSEVNERGKTAVFDGDENVRSVGARVGNAVLPGDEDGVVRRIKREVDGLASFAVAASEVYEGRPIQSARFDSGSAWIDYHGRRGAIPAVSFSDVHAKRVDPRVFEGKVVVVGASAPSLQDVHTTSTSGNLRMSGAEIHANAVSSILRNTPLRASPDWVAVLLTVVMGMLPALATLRFPRTGLVIAAVIALSYVALVQLAFDAGLILPLLYPLIAATMSAVGVLVVKSSTAVYERAHMHDLFKRFVPESVVEEVLDCADDDLRLAPKRVLCTIMVCDMRAFSAFAEMRPPEQVTEVLNRYLTEVSAAIDAHGGTLFRYQGDGILAGFGAPLEKPDHADRALDTVREIVGTRLPSFNAWLCAEHLVQPFRFGIGVNSGIVLCGSVGSERRLEYTAIGDQVNTAFRLETMTKSFTHQVLISDTTRAMLRGDASDLRYVDAAPVRGKQAKANLWTIHTGDDGADLAAANPVAAAADRRP